MPSDPSADTPSAYLTPREIAHDLRISVEVVKQALRNGALPGVHIGDRRDWRVKRSDYEAWVANGAPITKRTGEMGMREPERVPGGIIEKYQSGGKYYPPYLCVKCGISGALEADDPDAADRALREGGWTVAPDGGAICPDCSKSSSQGPSAAIGDRIAVIGGMYAGRTGTVIDIPGEGNVMVTLDAPPVSHSPIAPRIGAGAPDDIVLSADHYRVMR